ncbi:MAG: SpaA isopeptide-forming pilin-related protein [Blastochloris sp.]|nr:SpaA isopeptide-forming pilin-related protein [Blastochloris sp.]
MILPNINLPVLVAVTGSGAKGRLLVKAVDAFSNGSNGTFTNGVDGARFTLQHETTYSILESKTSDSSGEVLFDELPPGNYKLKVDGPKHQPLTRRVTIQPGATTSEQVVLEYSAVKVTWEVVETTIRDRYDIRLNFDFETQVPIAQVIIEPGAVNLPIMRAGQVYNSEIILTNVGLLRADNLQLRLPDMAPYFRMEVSGLAPKKLEAKESIRLGLKITCLVNPPRNDGVIVAWEPRDVYNQMAAAGMDPHSTAQTGGGGESGGRATASPCVFRYRTMVLYTYCCPNGLCFNGFIFTDTVYGVPGPCLGGTGGYTRPRAEGFGGGSYIGTAPIAELLGCPDLGGQPGQPAETDLAIVAHWPGRLSDPTKKVDRPTSGEYKALLMANEDNDDAGLGGAVDSADAQASASDDDLVKLTLKLLKIPKSGTVELQLPAGLRAFDKEGQELSGSQLTIPKGNPSKKLAAIWSGQVDIWVEGLASWTGGGKVIFSCNGKSDAVGLGPVDIAVDANRDGVIRYSGNYADSTLEDKPVDTTAVSKKFQFWLNDDDDSDEKDHPGSTTRDSNDMVINSKRDLEDFARLNIYIGGMQESILSGQIRVGLKWKSIADSPSIKLWRNLSLKGGTEYLTQDLVAAQHLKLQNVALIQGSATCILPASFWQDSNFSATQSNVFLLFEGVTAGTGELVITFHNSLGVEIGEGPGVWLDIDNIKRMYAGGYEYQDNPYKDKTDDTIVFVHGWNMSPEGSSSFAETMLKRLWHRGFKGRFALFRWNTYYSNDWQWVRYGGGIDAYLARYNDSEYIAWQAAAGLKTFVAELRGTRKHIVAHSMGNIVASEAFRQGMQASNYALMQGAVPSACYDEDEARIKQPTGDRHYGFPMWDNVTPDDDPDLATRALAYRGRFKDLSVNKVNFYLEKDFATSIAWEINNDQTKPEGGSLAANFRYHRTGVSGQKLFKYHWETIPGSQGTQEQVLDYYLSASNSYEAMSFACHTWGKAVGAWGATAGSITPSKSVNLGSSTFNLPEEDDPGFGDEHSGQFNGNIQNLKPFYNTLIDKLGVGPANP